MKLTGLRQARKNKKLTIQKIADHIGVTRQAWWQWEEGMREFRLNPVQTLQVCQLLDLGIDNLASIYKESNQTNP